MKALRTLFAFMRLGLLNELAYRANFWVQLSSAPSRWAPYWRWWPWWSGRPSGSVAGITTSCW